jgi:hypothetical protein
MEIKYVVKCYVQRFSGEPSLRDEIEFLQEPNLVQIQEALEGVELYNGVDYVIDYSSGAVLPDYQMPRKCVVKSIYAVVEKRFLLKKDGENIDE